MTVTDLLDLIEEPTQPEWSRDTNGDRWWRFHQANPAVYSALVRLARQWMDARPGEPCGMKALWERLRWETAVGDPSADYRLNNVMTPLYARALMEWEPDMEGLFRTRRRLSDDHRTPDPVHPVPSSEDANGAVFDGSQELQPMEIPTLWASLGERGTVAHLIKATEGAISTGSPVPFDVKAACGREGVPSWPVLRTLPKCDSCKFRVRQLVED